MLAFLGSFAAANQASAQLLDEQLVSVEITGSQLNAEAVAAYCDAGTTEDITISFIRTELAPVPIFGDKLYVWWASSDGSACDNVENLGDKEIANSTLELNDRLVTSGDLVFPDDLDLDFDSGTIMTYSGVCDATETMSSNFYKLCAAADSAGLLAQADQRIQFGEWVGAAFFEIDTTPPSKAVVSKVVESDGRLILDVTVEQTGEIDDIVTWTILQREVPKVDDELADCTEWVDATEVQIDSLVTDLDGTNTTVNVSGENGVSYEVCIWAIDNVGNIGAASDVITGTPRDECDFIECYPGEPPSGHCAALPSSSTGTGWLMASLIALAAVTARRRRTSP